MFLRSGHARWHLSLDALICGAIKREAGGRRHDEANLSLRRLRSQRIQNCLAERKSNSQEAFILCGDKDREALAVNPKMLT